MWQTYGKFLAAKGGTEHFWLVAVLEAVISLVRELPAAGSTEWMWLVIVLVAATWLVDVLFARVTDERLSAHNQHKLYSESEHNLFQGILKGGLRWGRSKLCTNCIHLMQYTQLLGMILLNCIMILILILIPCRKKYHDTDTWYMIHISNNWYLILCWYLMWTEHDM